MRSQRCVPSLPVERHCVGKGAVAIKNQGFDFRGDIDFFHFFSSLLKYMMTLRAERSDLTPIYVPVAKLVQPV